MARETSKSCIHLLKALADETRWKLIRELLSRPATVNELCKRLQATEYNISKHLRILREVGIITATKSGKFLRCEVAPEFRSLSRNKCELDLGCCTFRFDKPPK